MLVNPVMTEAQWKARDDARTLVEAEKIKGDPKRLSAAQDSASSMVDDSLKELEGLRRVAGGASKDAKKSGGVASRLSSLKINKTKR